MALKRCSPRQATTRLGTRRRSVACRCRAEHAEHAEQSSSSRLDSLNSALSAPVPVLVPAIWVKHGQLGSCNAASSRVGIGRTAHFRPTRKAWTLTRNVVQVSGFVDAFGNSFLRCFSTRNIYLMIYGVAIIDATARSRPVNLVWLVPAPLSISVRENSKVQTKTTTLGGAAAIDGCVQTCVD